ncbi:hypothetical protein EMIHUDRAFT_206392 [Emiliania huxleyi CCMP1516]|uniref:Glycosyltransferase 2-like domain-containing protein n=2 Tax=Emiliania huxleyi TaxID=2903 RepID=A0A0D3JNY0_EMIH1|nr:hypothetical protein EMIHUDRAFT_206392 [Emiliania huxleyi CCMP1516]EOD25215.1 hypothetical protein EMIHUDRAFT_206392 [Emiliania huxleyi CCMP1516]|eukprot:XP_005777644.1 hypothetical protein EMIHUDRAFT_206392 [Emiliania huxleyi CCMP1516]
MLSSLLPSSLAFLAESDLTIGIKHTSAYGFRREQLDRLLRSIRRRYATAEVIVADDGCKADRTAARTHNVTLVCTEAGSGLSLGRNTIVRRASTEFVLLLDDDVVFSEATDLAALHDALVRDPGAALAGGCYDDLVRGGADCFNLAFSVTGGGTAVAARFATLQAQGGGCGVVDATHNFFLARRSALVQHGWDARQRVMEHETFFYALWLHGQRVLACPAVRVQHNTSRSLAYVSSSLRFGRMAYFLQYLCKDFPEVASFATPFIRWDCATRTYCEPTFNARFPYNAPECGKAMPWWEDEDDRSAVELPLVTRAHVEAWGAVDAGSASPTARELGLPRVPLLMMIMTHPTSAASRARRTHQRATWLSKEWRQRDRPWPVPWRYLYVMGEDGSPTPRVSPSSTTAISGDSLRLLGTAEGYRNLVHKVVAAMRWAATEVDFDVLLKADDDVVVHVSSLYDWVWRLPPQRRHALYAGYVWRGKPVVRSDKLSQSWGRWAVPYEQYGEPTYPPYADGSAYALGRDAVALVLQGVTERERAGAPLLEVEDAFVGTAEAAAKAANRITPADKVGKLFVPPASAGDNGSAPLSFTPPAHCAKKRRPKRCAYELRRSWCVSLVALYGSTAESWFHKGITSRGTSIIKQEERTAAAWPRWRTRGEQESQRLEAYQRQRSRCKRAGGECAREALPAWAAGGKLVGKPLLPQGACKCSVPTEREL